jgi:polysaccharide pyruvyl transferase WcaK-like protein
MDRAGKRVGLLNHLGGGNLGDDATMDAVMHNIKTRWPNAVILGLSMNPNDTQTRHGIPSYAIRRRTWDPDHDYRSPNTAVTSRDGLKNAVRRCPPLFRLLQAIHFIAINMPRSFCQELLFLVHSFRITKSLDLLIICGGGQLLDSWGGAWKFPYTLFKWTVLAKLSRAKCYFINVGAGPLNHSLGKYFIKYSLMLADYVSFRDDYSRTLARQIGFGGKAEVLADSVYSLPIPGSHTQQRRGTRTVGIAPMAFCDPLLYWEKDQDVYDCLIRNLSLLGSWLAGQHTRVAMFSTDIRFDAKAIDDLKMSLSKFAGNAGSGLIIQPPIKTVEELLFEMSSMDYVVTCRFHGVIFAHLLNIPVLAISHHDKVATIMNECGLSEYCLDARTVNADLLISTFTRLVDNRDEVKARMSGKAAWRRNRVIDQFDGLFPR